MPDSETERSDLQKALEAEAKRMCVDMGFDSLQIVATALEVDGTTTRYPAGHGNWHARMGSLRQTLVLDDEDTREWVRKRNAEEES